MEDFSKVTNQDDVPVDLWAPLAETIVSTVELCRAGISQTLSPLRRSWYLLAIAQLPACIDLIWTLS